MDMATFWRQRSGAGAYVLGLAFALAATAMHWAIEPWVGSRIPFLFYLPMTLVAAAVAGRGCGGRRSVSSSRVTSSAMMNLSRCS